MKNDDFTVLTGVPKPILGKALKYAARETIDAARETLRNACRDLMNYTDNSNRLPEIQPLRDHLQKVTVLVDEYETHLATANRIFEEGESMIADAKEEETQG